MRRLFSLTLLLPVLGCAALAGPSSSPAPPLAPEALPDGSVYEGERRHGRFDGEGRLVHPSGRIYEGRFEDGAYHGVGRLTEPSGEVYDGDFVRGMRHGKGRVEARGLVVYEGDFRLDEPDGRGLYRFRSGARYEGEFLRGEFHGQGTFHYVDGTRYDGSLRHSSFSGLGKMTSSDGTVYEGAFEDDLFHGHGTHTDALGNVYTGSFEKGFYHGQGRMTLTDGRVFEGDFENGAFTGRGTLRAPDGTTYEGEFENATYHGEGTLSSSDGSRYVGDFDQGYFHGEGRLETNARVYEGGFAQGVIHGAGVLTWTDEEGDRRVAHGEWERGTYVRGDADDLLAPAPVDGEALLYAQTDRMTAALEDVEASRPGVPDLYFVGFAGWGAQRVFAREVRHTAALAAERFDASGRSLTLINEVRDPDAAPLATVTNLRIALAGIAERMDVEEDVLFLYVTSHGSEETGVGVSLAALDLNPLGPDRLRTLLDEAGIRWRVIVVSACHSGTFVEPLRDERTLVISASAADKESFGCSDEAQFTTFGGAFLRDELRDAPSFVAAFERARERVRQYEAERALEHSEPQIAAGAAIGAKLAEWRASLAPDRRATAEATPANRD